MRVDWSFEPTSEEIIHAQRIVRKHNRFQKFKSRKIFKLLGNLLTNTWDSIQLKPSWEGLSIDLKRLISGKRDQDNARN